MCDDWEAGRAGGVAHRAAGCEKSGPNGCSNKESVGGFWGKVPAGIRRFPQEVFARVVRRRGPQRAPSKYAAIVIVLLRTAPADLSRRPLLRTLSAYASCGWLLLPTPLRDFLPRVGRGRSFGSPLFPLLLGQKRSSAKMLTHSNKDGKNIQRAR